MKKWITCLLAVLISFTSAGLIYAVEGKRMNGKATEINLEQKTFVLTMEKETWKIIWNDKTNFVMDGKKVAPEDLKNNTDVVVAGKTTEQEKTLEAVIVAWGKMPEEKDPKDPGKERQIPSIFGIMSDLNVEEKTFKLETKDREGNPIVFSVTYGEKTIFIREKKEAKPEDFKNGEEVTVAGRINPEEKTLLAIAVGLGKMELPPKNPEEEKDLPFVFGTMKDLNLTDKTFNLELKDKEGNAILLSVVYGEKTAFFREKKKVTPEDFKDGEEVTVVGRVNREEKKILAIAVMLGRVEPPKNPGDEKKMPMLYGIMNELNLTDKTFKLEIKDREGNPVVLMVTYTEKTPFIREKKKVTPEDFKNGELVTVTGRINMEEKTMLAFGVVLGKVEIPSNPREKEPDSPPGAPYKAKGIPGLITDVNLEKMQFTIEIKGQVTLTVQYYEWTDFVRDGMFVLPKALKNGARVLVYGPVDTEQKLIEAHYVVW